MAYYIAYTSLITNIHGSRNKKNSNNNNRKKEKKKKLKSAARTHDFFNFARNFSVCFAIRKPMGGRRKIWLTILHIGSLE